MKKRRFSSLFIIGFLLSIGIAIVSIFFNASPIEGFYISLLGIAITLILDGVSRIEEFKAILETVLKIRIKASYNPFLWDSLLKIAEYWEYVDSQYTHLALKEIAKRDLLIYIERLHDISEQRISVSATDAWPLHIVFQEAKETLRVVSMVSTSWWQSPVGRKHLERNLQQSREGVKVMRVFIYDELDSYQKDLMKIMQDEGMEIFHVHRPLVPPELVQGYAIADDRLLQITQYDIGGATREHEFSTRPDDIDKALRNFDKLLLYSEKYSTSA